MPVQVLHGKCKESQRLIDWVKSGVDDAITRQYLKRLFFGISKDAAGTDLIEVRYSPIRRNNDFCSNINSPSVIQKIMSSSNSRGVWEVNVDPQKESMYLTITHLVYFNICL